jgi:FixJ family two-component response regulator
MRALIEAAKLPVAAVAESSEFVRKSRSPLTACVVMGARSERRGRLDRQQEAIVQNSKAPVIMATAYGDVAAAVRALRAGAFDVIERPFLGKQLVPSVRRAVAQGLAGAEHLSEHERIRRSYGRLTPRERQVLCLVAAGMKSREIALHLGLRDNTVEVYRCHLKQKMGARNAADLVRMAHTMTDLSGAPANVKEGDPG